MMWELIAANKKRSLLLFSLMAVCLALLGYLIGGVVYPDRGGYGGLFIALGLWSFLAVLSVFAGDSILLASTRAREVTHDLHPRLFNIVEEMKIAASLPAMPKVFIIDDPAPNAFATGTRPNKSAIAVTTGLLSRLNRDELQGVVAHEMSHIMNRDVQFITYAGIMLGSIVLLSEVFLRWMWFAPASSRKSRVGVSKGGGQAQVIIIFVALAVAILAPIFARLLYFAISRKREYLADASAARLTRYPEGLASALEKISSADIKPSFANKVTAPMYIVNPLEKESAALSGLSSTHPPIAERVKILRSMAGGAGYLNYQRAFSKVRGKPAMIIPGSGIRMDEKIPMRAPSAETEKAAGKEAVRDAMDLARAASGYAFMICACGLRIKVPPDFKDSKVLCPRCGRSNEVPLATVAAVGAVPGETALASKAPGVRPGEGLERSRPAREKPGPPLEYVRRGRGWESFFCSCGKLLQISPAFCAKNISCRHCGKVIKIAGENA